MGFLLDTNLISELRKRAKCNPSVLTWFQANSVEDLYLSVLTTGEIRQGIERCRLKDKAQARVYEKWLYDLEEEYANRILPVTAEIADTWGHLSCINNVSVIDGLLAATASHHDLTVATRNERDFQRSGVDYINPFRP
jgi:toxin FitB